MLIVLGVLLAGAAALIGLIVWLGWAWGALAALVAMLVIIGLCLWIIRPWHMRWRATDDEVARDMPCDELTPEAVVSTRAVTIDARPRDVWPWLVQMGFGRAGWYSYDRIDNDGIPSADRMVPEFQDLQVGDQIKMIPGLGPNVISIDRDHALVAAADDGSSSWCLELYERDGATRLLSRWRNRWEATPATAIVIAMSDPGAFIMEQRILREIKRRVEAQ